jgi:hypothetical protein
LAGNAFKHPILIGNGENTRPSNDLARFSHMWEAETETMENEDVFQ